MQKNNATYCASGASAIVAGLAMWLALGGTRSFSSSSTVQTGSAPPPAPQPKVIVKPVAQSSGPVKAFKTYRDFDKRIRTATKLMDGNQPVESMAIVNGLIGEVDGGQYPDVSLTKLAWLKWCLSHDAKQHDEGLNYLARVIPLMPIETVDGQKIRALQVFALAQSDHVVEAKTRLAEWEVSVPPAMVAEQRPTLQSMIHLHELRLADAANK